MDRAIVCLMLTLGCVLAEPPTYKLQGRAKLGYVQVREDFKNYTTLFSILAHDNDDGDNLQLTVGDQQTREYFKVHNDSTGNNVTFHIELIKSLDRETKSEMKLLFFLQDKQQNEIKISLTLYITDVNDNSPKFYQHPYTWELHEQPCNTNGSWNSFSNIYANDTDNGENRHVTYSMEPKSEYQETRDLYNKTFDIDSTTGVVTQRQCVDYETNSYYQFLVTAKDGGPNGGKSSTVDLIIRVKDDQDTPPFFSRNSFRETIPENVAVGTTVAEVQAIDGDRGVSQRVEYTADSTCPDLFGINETSGIITTNKSLDRDCGIVFNNSGECLINVTATEVPSSEHNYTQYNTTTTSTNVTITVNDVNDNSPTFDLTSVTASIAENSPAGVQVKFNKSLHVEDIDQGQNSVMNIEVECSNSSPCATFKVSPKTIHGSGDIIILVLNSSLLDYETRETMNVTVIATEQENESHCATVQIEVNITDVNDEDPKFDKTGDGYIYEIFENVENGTSVGNLTAKDADKTPEFNTLTYSIVGGNGKFAVNNSTGEIYTNCTSRCNDSFDREVQDTYYMTCTATDCGGRRDSVSVEVKLKDENDNAPEFSRQTYLVFKMENDRMLNLIKVEATDKDIENNSKLQYYIKHTTDEYFISNNTLTINSTDGMISLNNSIDYEALSSVSQKDGNVNITIEVQDKGSPRKSSQATIQLSIQDLNDNDPQFGSSNYSYSLSENATTKDYNDATQVGNVSAFDDDGTERNSLINYFIWEGGADRFDIDSDTGMVKVRLNAKFDRETKSFYNLTILAIDQGSPPRKSNTTMIVDITDVNDECPAFSKRTYTTRVKEDMEINDLIINSTATDPDENSDLHYTVSEVVAEDENGSPVNESLVLNYFGIHDNNGSVYVKDTLDRETAETLRITITVEDMAAYYPRPQTSNATLIVTLLDVNDNAPEFEQHMYNANVIENANDGTYLIQTIATDRDMNRTMSYKLLNETSSFVINNKTGWISKKGELDREKYQYVLLVVIATDDGVPEKNSSVTVNVTIDDFNDNAPNITTQNTTLKVMENETINTEVIDINATDNDIGPNANITFSIRMKENGYFNINSTTGIITVAKALDREQISQFSVVVVAKDNPVDVKVQKTNEKTIVIKIGDVNDNEPQFRERTYTGSIHENADINQTIMSIKAMDNDTDDNAKLRYEMWSDTDLFKIDDTGKISVNSSLRDKVGEYSLSVIAFDHGSPVLNGSTIVNISVLDINLHNPQIQNIPQGREIKVYECARKGTIIHTFNYTDDDHGVNAKVRFNISQLNDNITDIFKMMQNGSLQVVAGKLDSGQNGGRYQFQVQATDLGEPPLSSEKITIKVIILDVNDHLPSFEAPTLNLSVKENTTSEMAIGKVEAHDEDKDSQPCYTSNSDQDYFSVKKSTGEIFYNQSVDYETKKSVTFTVEVNDCSIEKNVSDYCNKTEGNKIAVVNKDVQRTINVTVDIIDIDDNPPIFLSKTLSTGMRRNTEPATVLTLNLRNSSYIHDADTPPNGELSWQFRNYGNITASSNLHGKIQTESGTEQCEDGIKHIFCITRNGTIVNNKYFSEDLIGYFTVRIEVSDKGGSDIANLTIYLIGDSQVLSLHIRERKEDVSQFKDKLLSQLSSILGPYTAVFDNLQDHKEKGQVLSSSSDLHFHIVSSDTHEVIPGNEALRLLDNVANTNEMLRLKNNYNILTVSKQVMVDSVEEDSSEKTFYILLAVSISEALIISIVVYVSLATKNKYRRKLRAANIKPTDMELHVVQQEMSAVPGSNMYAKQYNPLLNAKLEEREFDHFNEESRSVVSGDSLNIDDNAVDNPHTVYDRIEEKEVTLDMYTDDTANSISSEDLLESALNYHKMSKESSKEVDDDYDALDGETSQEAAQFENYSFTEDLESTDI